MKAYKIQVLRTCGPNEGTELTSLIVRTWAEVITNKRYFERKYLGDKVRVIRHK